VFVYVLVIVAGDADGYVHFLSLEEPKPRN
jgi:hypothetical protein